MCKNVLKINESTDIFDFGDFTVPKIVHRNENINKILTKKDQGNFKHCFRDNSVRNNLVRSLPDRIKP